jgi:hypothetical protein
MSYDDRDLAATLERLYPPVIGGPGWDEVLARLGARTAPSARRAPSMRRNPPGRSLRSLVAAALVGAAVATAPALAFSTTVRQLIRLYEPTHPAPLGWTRPRLVAKVTGLSFPIKKPFGLPMVTVRFTIGEVGRPPGTGITFGSSFLVHVASRTGAPSWPYFVRAHGSHGHYVATVPLPRGGVGGVEVAGWINVRKGPSAANGTFWIPVVVTAQSF